MSWSMWNAPRDRDYYDQQGAAPPAEEPDYDAACPGCLGAGELCTKCERPPALCDCPEPELCRCGLCQGLGTREDE